MAEDLTIVPQPDGYLYALGVPTEDPSTRIANRFITQFLSAFNASTGRGTVFMGALAGGDIRTNADLVTLVATAGAQVRALETDLALNVVLQSVELISATFIDLTTLKIAVRLNSTEGSAINDIVVTA
jgi:hypothetical protein